MSNQARVILGWSATPKGKPPAMGDMGQRLGNTEPGGGIGEMGGRVRSVNAALAKIVPASACCGHRLTHRVPSIQACFAPMTNSTPGTGGGRLAQGRLDLLLLLVRVQC
jgi:hypothetical protein